MKGDGLVRCFEVQFSFDFPMVVDFTFSSPRLVRMQLILIGTQLIVKIQLRFPMLIDFAFQD